MAAPPGGFLLGAIPASPASSTSSPRYYRALPAPRPSPLKPGSKHEAALIRYLDDGLLDIFRKYTKKFNEGGYHEIKSLTKDLEKYVELIWVSGTPSIQIAYLLQIANNFNEYLASFTPHFPSIFSFLDTLDRSFYSLITGQPSSPVGSPISEPMSKHRLSTTEKVRLKSIIERTRLHVVKIMEEGPSNMEDMDIPTESDPHIHNPLSPSSERDTVQDATRDGLLEGENRGRDSGDNGEEDEEDEDEDVDIEMLVAKIYERCLFEVGESLKRTE